MDPVRSRCLCVRVPGPSYAAIQEQLALVARKEGFALPPAVSSRVALVSQRNLRRALLMMEVAYVQQGGALPEETKVQPPDWELYTMVRVLQEPCNRDQLLEWLTMQHVGGQLELQGLWAVQLTGRAGHLH